MAADLLAAKCFCLGSGWYVRRRRLQDRRLFEERSISTCEVRILAADRPFYGSGLHNAEAVACNAVHSAANDEFAVAFHLTMFLSPLHAIGEVAFHGS